MAIRADRRVSVFVAVGAEFAEFIYPSWSDSRLTGAIKKLLKATQNFIPRPGQEEKRDEARLEFFNEVCLDIGNYVVLPPDMEDKEENEVPCNAETHPDWKDKVPPNWAVSSAMYFELKNILTEDDVKNLKSQ